MRFGGGIQQPKWAVFVPPWPWCGTGGLGGGQPPSGIVGGDPWVAWQHRRRHRAPPRRRRPPPRREGGVFVASGWVNANGLNRISIKMVAPLLVGVGLLPGAGGYLPGPQWLSPGRLLAAAPGARALGFVGARGGGGGIKNGFGFGHIGCPNAQPRGYTWPLARRTTHNPISDGPKGPSRQVLQLPP
jgi:hypothetical protein